MDGTVGFLVRGVYRGLVMAAFLAVAACGGSSSNSGSTTGSGGGTTTYTISGTITGASTVSVALSGASSATTTTDASGNYQFTGLADGSYTVAPTLAGDTFSPANLAVTINGASDSGENFTATAATYTLSGTVQTSTGGALAGVSLQLSGAASAIQTANSSGQYTFANLAAGTYTVTPTLPGYTFSPANAAVTISNGNMSATTFVGTAAPPPTYTISGTVSGAVAGGVTITLSGAGTATTTTAANGSYTFSGLAAGNYTVTPSLTGYTFGPTSTAVTINSSDVTGTNFTSNTVVAASYSISGTVSGAVASGVTITLSGAGTGTTTTAANGTYTFSGLAAGNYTVTPSLSGYTFSPAATAVAISTANVAGKNFTASAVVTPTYAISGAVSGAVASGVTITLSGAGTGTTTTAANGTYTFSGLAAGNYTVTPSLSGYTFSPTATAVAISTANVTGQNFTSSAVVVPTYSISGTVSGAWVSGVTVTLSGAHAAVTSTDSSGNYGFSGLAAGNYTVTPSLNGYTFTPSSLGVSLTNASVTGQNFSDSGTSTGGGVYSISGTLSYAGSKTGLVNVMVFQACSNCGGQTPVYGTAVSLTGSPGAYSGSYTVRGVTPGTYTVVAQIDTLGTGQLNMSNPIGETTALNVTNANVNANLSLVDPGTLTPAAPSKFKVNPESGVGLVLYNPGVTILPSSGVAVEADTGYRIYWGTDTAASNGGYQTFSAQGQNKSAYILTGLPSGSVYFKMVALVGTNASAATPVVGPVTIGPTTGGNTVSGTVTFSGTATGPMMVGLSAGSKTVYYDYIAHPVSPQAYSVSGVPSGIQQVVVWLDQNNDQTLDAGDLTNFQGLSPVVNVTGNLTNLNETLTSAPEAVTLATTHVTGTGGDSYSFTVYAGDGTRRAVAMTLFSGSNVAVPVDLGALGDSSAYLSMINNTVAPTVGSSYQFLVTYSDGTSSTITATVTGVLNSFATNLAVNSASPYSTTVPQFTWGAPASPPASYLYFLSLYGPNASWYYPYNASVGMPSTQTSVVYDADGNASAPSLTTGNTYTWQIVVQDSATGNQAVYQTTYTP
ncbi:MAG: carboxypeptidase regulatory-like domain-containing protein [Gammaproteobacteria bacterium]|nr:carboxypeptidase regulatory-like domain-containing protein [Gammaproteobacteria bacterium]